MSFRFYLALYISKIIAFMMRILGKRATYLPGNIAIKICPEFLGKLQRPKTVIAVTGTNGKTTVCNLINDVLEYLGYKPANNRYGSNINAGIASTMLANSTFTGKSKKDIAVFEVDERSSLLIYPYIKPDFILCTNLFRDSIKRNAHTDFISYVINKSISEKTTLILNGDDLICSALGSDCNKKIFFGIQPLESENSGKFSPAADVMICPKCGTVLKYDFVRYNHIGKAFCPNCDFKSPDCKYIVTDINKDNKTVNIACSGQVTSYNMINDNIINIYNTVTAIALLSEIGLENEKIAEAFLHLSPVKSRLQIQENKGITIVRHLAKGQNHIACSRVFDYISQDSKNKAVLINIDDRDDAKHDSETITWLYDTNYEYLRDDSIKQVIVGGKRQYDQYLRLLIAGVDPAKIKITRYETDTPNLVDFTIVDKVFVLYDIYTVDMAQTVVNSLVERIDSEVTE